MGYDLDDPLVRVINIGGFFDEDEVTLECVKCTHREKLAVASNDWLKSVTSQTVFDQSIQRHYKCKRCQGEKHTFKRHKSHGMERRRRLPAVEPLDRLMDEINRAP